MAAKLFFVFIFLSFIGFSENPLNKKLSVDFKNIKIEAALDEIQTLGMFFFSYNSKIVNTKKLITYSSHNENIAIILNAILGKEFDYKHRGKYIIIQKSKPIRYEKKEIVIQGNISSSKDSSRVSGVTVYEIDKLKTTSTNKNGDFNLTISSEQKEIMFLVSKENYKDTILTSNNFRDTNLVIYLEPETDTSKRRKFFKMDSIPWLKIFYTDKILNTIRNVDLSENKKFQLSLIPFIGTNGKLSGKITNNFSLNLISGYAYAVDGIEVGGVLNLIKDTMNGVQIAGFGNIVGGKVNGVQIAGAINYCHDSIKGVQIAGATNIATKNIFGTQIAGTFNFAPSVTNGGQLAGTFNYSNKIQNGFQMAGTFNYAPNITNGSQLAGTFNYSNKILNGFQIGGVFNYTSSITNGAQLAGTFNYSNEVLDGFQISGLFNYTKSLSGLQISPFNFSDSVHSGLPIGFFSYVKSGFHKFELSYNDYLSGGISFRTGLHKFYNIFSIDYYHHDLNPLTSFGYGIGTQINFNRKLFTNLELSARKLISINNFSSSFDQFNVLGKLNINFGYNLGKNLSILGGPELNLFAYNNSNTFTDPNNFYKQRTISNTKNQSTFLDLKLGYKVALRF